MDLIQKKEKTFKKEVKVFWEEVQNKLNFSYNELNELYKENRKFNFAAKGINLENHNNLNESFHINNNNNNPNNDLMSSIEFKNL
jgi:hypothetical protein